MKIGIDFDKVFVSLPPLVPPSIIDMFYKKKTATLTYRMPGAIEKKIRALSHSTLFRHPLKENIESLIEISKKNPEIYLISSRFSFLKEQTDLWLRDQKIEKYFKKMYFNFEDKQPHIFKDEIIKKLGIDIFIDDDLDLLMYLNEKNSKIKLYFLTDKKIPQSSLNKNIQQVYDLEEFYKKYL